MKLGKSHYDYNSILDAKFESVSSSSFGDVTSEGNKSSNLAIHHVHQKRVSLLKKNEFLCPESFSSTQS